MSLARLDLAFCVDLTGSMGSFIAAAREQIVRILDALRGVEEDLPKALKATPDEVNAGLMRLRQRKLIDA